MKEIPTKTKILVVILLVGTFLGFLNQTLMNVALPSIMKDFQITASQGQWMANGYLLMNGIMVPATAFLIERFKTRNLYLTSLGLFITGTAIAGFSPSFLWLIVGRMVQAMGAGILGPLMMVTIMRIFPVERRGSAMGLIGLALNFAPAIGPTLSGWIVQTYNWRFLFYLILPLAVLDFLFAMVLLRGHEETSPAKLSYSSLVLSTIGLGSLLLGFSNAGSGDWLTFKVLGFICIGVITLFFFIRLQGRIDNPLLNFEVFRYKKFTLATICNFFVTMGLFGGMILIPMFLQNVQGIKPFESGLMLLPGAVLMAALSPITGKIYDRYGYRVLSLVGLVVLTIGTLLLGLCDLSTTKEYIVIVQTLRSAALALILMPIQTEAMNALPARLITHGNAMYNTIRLMAGSIGTASLITVMTLSAKHYTPTSVSTNVQLLAEVHGIQMAFLTTAGLTVVAFILLIFFKNKPQQKRLPREKKVGVQKLES